MKPHLLGIAIAFLALPTSAPGSPKIALVRVKDIYVEQPATKAAQEKAAKAKEAVLMDPRAEELRQGIDMLRELQKTISNPDKKPTSEEGRKLAREFEIKRLETRTLQEDFEKFRAEREKAIHTEMVAEMRSILNRISDIARRTAQQRGYDILIDSSGDTNSSVPFVLYSRNSPDITEDVMAAMKAEMPPPAAGIPPSMPSPPHAAPSAPQPQPEAPSQQIPPPGP